MNVFGMMKTRLGYETQSLRLTGENMANLHTPGYKARKATPLSFGDALGTLPLCKTKPSHLPPKTQEGNFRIEQDHEGQETLTGNTVSYQNELHKANKSGQMHKQMTMIWESHLSMLNTALKV